MFIKLFKVLRKVKTILSLKLGTLVTKIYLRLNGATINSLISTGIPYIYVARYGKLKIGENAVLNNTYLTCESGFASKCRLKISNNAHLIIGNCVGMSGVCISCTKSIIIGNHVMLGIGTHIYDTDFHSLNMKDRLTPQTDLANTNSKPVIIGNNAFIGAHSIILKGVEIGENTIVAAGSVVTKSIPANVIAGGNPCVVIRNINS
ncbi:MAG: acyltransferase [Pseudopedobacter saltans]|uniref:Acyltransferase n=1 Tax=Pseudopedobacter saltans TaxID=151895 RepID=A0A2W5EKL3_9SPHI|nr:MAG: acyltransferase [Pseudopedobacter saltans]